MAIAPNPDPWLPTSPVPVARDATTITVLVSKFDALEDTSIPPTTVYSNVACEVIEFHAGPDPGKATFRYKFTEADSTAPQSAEQALDTNYALEKTITPGDRIAVKTTRWDGATDYLFDGYVMGFQAALDDQTERVEFTAVGIAKRLWDTPIPGALMRNCDTPANGLNNDVATDIVAQFNPKGQPNRTPKNGEKDIGGSRKHHTFLDPALAQATEQRASWTLSDAARYLLLTMNAEETYVFNPDLADLDKLLDCREPKEGQVYDPEDPATYDSKPIIVSDKPITGRDWPTVFHDLIRNAGFDMRFSLFKGVASGLPRTQLKVYRPQASKTKTLYLQPRFESLDPSYSNTAKTNVGRDISSVANVWTVKGRPLRRETTFILSPLFPMRATDASPGNLGNFLRANIQANPSLKDSYRTFGIDEIGEGHYLIGTAAPLNGAFDFNPLLKTGEWVKRRRKPIGTLFSKTPDGKPRKASLAYSVDYSGARPSIWDQTGTWKNIPSGMGWELLDDRIGFRVTADNPNSWGVGRDPLPIVLRLVEKFATEGAEKITFRLTVCYEEDQDLSVSTTRRDESPVPQKIERVIDARDKYQKNVIDAKGEFNTTANPVTDRDDTEAAKAMAVVYQLSADMGVLEGACEIPYLTKYYEIGDRISGIAGRGLGFRTDGGSSSGQKVYPIVEGIRWTLGGRQSTTLFLSDEAQQRHLIERKLSR